MLGNFWYAVEHAHAVTDRPVGVQVLGRRFVLFRDVEGQVAALDDVCVHRGGSLAGGWTERGCVVCPYHGWKYDRAGACVDIPANRRDHIPKRARVDALPVQERYGWIWLFLGELPEAERPPILDIPEHGDASWRCITGEFTWNANYARVVENGIDIAHAPFVHRNSFGNIDEPEVEDYAVEADEMSGDARLQLLPPLPRGLWKLVRKQRTPVKVRVGYHMPSFTRLELELGNGWKTVLYDANVPVDAYTTRTLFLAFRNFFTGRWADRDARRRVMKIFYEDQPTVEAQRPELLPYDMAAELHVKSDALALAYRKTHNQLLDRGWGVEQPVAGNARRSDQLKAV